MTPPVTPVHPPPQARRHLAIVLLLAAAAMLWIGSGLRRVPPSSDGAGEGTFLVRAWITGKAETLEPGWALAPPLLASILEFPVGVQNISVRAGSARGEPLLTREGVGVFAAGTLAARADAARPGDLARAFPGGWGTDAAAQAEAAAQLFGGDFERSLSDHARTRSISELLLSSPESGVLAEQALTILAASGLTLEGTPAIAFYPTSGRTTAEPRVRPRDGRRLLLIGLDGADWEIIDPLIAAGRMPHMQRLIASGVRARLRTINPALSPLLWTSIVTGVGPAKHGILDFVAVSPETGTAIPVTSNLRRVKALWNIMTGAGRTSGVIAWWASWPAEAVDGFLVSDRVAYQLFGGAAGSSDLGRLTHPESLWLPVRPMVAHPSDITDDEVGKFIEKANAPDFAEHRRRLAAILASTRTYMAIGMNLLRAYDPDFKALYLEGTDTIAHDFMRYRAPAMEGVTPEMLAAFGEVVDRYYEYADGLLGEILTLADLGTVVLVCSDHGFKTGRNRPETDPRIEAGGAADWHRSFGILVMSGPGIRQGASIDVASVMDITPTILSVMGLPVAGDMEGKVIADAFVMPSPPERIATYENGAAEGGGAPSDTVPIASSVDDEMVARLKALGYVSGEGSNAMNNAGVTLLEAGKYEEAARAFEEAVKHQPRFLAAMINIGRVRMLMKDYDGALRALDEVLAADDNRVEAYNLIGNIHMTRGKLDLAEQALRKGLRISPDDTDLRNSLGLLQDQRGNTDEAIGEFQTVIEVDPDYAEAYNNIGLIHRRRGASHEALAMFEKAIAADPAFPGSYNNLGLVYQDLGRLTDAEAILERGMVVAPENAVIANSLGTIVLALNRPDRAGELFAKAVALDPSYASAHNNLGAIAGMKGDAQRAYDGYRKAVELDPGYIDARFNLATVHIQRSEPKLAMKQLEAILKIDPNHVNAMLQEGFLMTRAGDLEAALARATRAASVAPENPECQNLLADIFVRLNRKDDARRALQRSLALKADQPAVVQELQRLDAAAGS